MKRVAILISLIISIFFTCSIFISPLSFAQESKGEKKEKKGKAEKEKEEKKKTPAGPAKIDMPKPEEKEVSRDELADKKRDEAIKMLKDIITRFEKGPKKADVMFQLAELYWEKSKYVYFQEMYEYEKRLDECNKKTKDLKACEKIKINTRQSELYRKQALDIYEKIIKEYPDYPRKDEVLFVLGYNLYEMGKKNEGVKYYWELIKKYPKSKYAPDAYLSLGEHFFNNNEVFKAVQAYEKALTFNDPKITVVALYKLAWCDYNLGEYEKGIEKLKQVVAFAQKEGDKTKIRLEREALNDLALFFSQVDAVDEAKDYWEKVAGRQKLKDLLKTLARVYDDQGKYDQAIKTYRLVINEFPNAPECPEFQSNIVQNYKKLNNTEMVKKEIRRLVDLYKPNSPWANQNAENKFALEKAYELTEEALRDIVQEYHREAQKTKDVKTYALARDIYKEYLDNFPKAEHSYSMRFFYAEILWALQDYENAAINYALVVKQDPKGKYSVTAAYNRVLAYEKMVEIMEKGQKAETLKEGKVDEKKSKGAVKRVEKFIKLEKGKTYEKKEIPKIELELAKACDEFTQLAPNHKEFFAVKFKAATIYYKYNHFDEASKRFGEFIEKFPDNKFALGAADMILNSYEIKEDWASLFFWASKFIKIKPLASQKDPAEKNKLYQAHLQEVIEGSAFNMIIDMQKKGKTLDAAVAFRDYVNKYPQAKHTDRALNNAHILFADAKYIDKAIEAALLLVEKFPKSEFYEPTFYKLGYYYEKIADFVNASKYYEIYFEKLKKKTKEAGDAIYNAALFREATGDLKGAIANYQTYIKAFPTNKDVIQVQMKIASIYNEMKDYEKAKAIYKGIVGKPKEANIADIIEAQYEMAMIYKKLGQIPAYEKELQALLKIAEKLKKGDASEKTFYYIANARFLLTDSAFKNYMSLKLQLPESVMKKQLKEKAEKLDKLVKEYTAILQMGQGDVGIAALCRIGMMYQDFTKTLLEAPIPKNLNEEQKEIYIAELQNMAFPVEEKAIEAYEKSLAKSYELSIYNEYSRIAQERLDGYKPGSYPDLPETRYVAKEYFYGQLFYPSLTTKVEEPPKKEEKTKEEVKKEEGKKSKEEGKEEGEGETEKESDEEVSEPQDKEKSPEE
ncbi:MAG: tetratricopeptide repeat protein [Deltaproteobacteria bacterium]|nr:tetratricopeptide repeat protein [Deltaproteobacteria bacterium]